ncbi:MAG TPA: sigma-70 family RNA polymerase sigma factor [Planctomycetota bacterium]|nr:sigma-70 family RNA polymerase sigma factor [Planctomycetota bacterium]
MDEKALVEAARLGDGGAFGRLVERYSRAVLARQFACARERWAAEDLAQETFVRAWRGLERLEEDRAFGSWLLSIAGHVGQEWIRRKKTALKARSTLARSAEEGAGRREGPLDLPLAEALSRLPSEAQQLLALRHDRGWSCEEIARELGRPLGSVTKALSRAYAELRERLVRR